MIESYFVEPQYENNKATFLKAMIPKKYFDYKFKHGNEESSYNGTFDDCFSYDIAEYFNLQFIPTDLNILYEMLPENTGYCFHYSDDEDEMDEDEMEAYGIDPIYRIQYTEIIEKFKNKLCEE